MALVSCRMNRNNKATAVFLWLTPIIYKEKLKGKSVVFALLLMVGVLITIPEFTMENDITKGIACGMFSGFLYAILALINRYLSKDYSGRKICMYQQGTAAIMFLPFVLVSTYQCTTTDIVGIAFLGVVCTATAYVLYVSSQKYLRAQVVGLIGGMETVYGICYAFLLLGETPSLREIIGGSVILGVAAISSSLSSARPSLPCF